MAMRPSRPRCLLAATLPWLLIPAASAAQPEYAGSYSRGGVDSVEQLVLLQDRTFCYALMAGALDLLAGGRWQPAAGTDGGIELHEIKADRTVFPATVEDNGSAKTVFDFHGHSFSGAELAAFGVSASDSNPATLRPLFTADKNGWSPSYALPPMDPAQAHYFFVAHAPRSMDGNGPEDVLAVTVYALEGSGKVRIGFDITQAMPPLQLHARLQDETLWMQDRAFGQRTPLSAELIAAVRQDCIDPVLAGSPRAAQDSAPGMQRLRPLRSFTLPASAVQGAPWFPEE